MMSSSDCSATELVCLYSELSVVLHCLTSKLKGEVTFERAVFVPLESFGTASKGIRVNAFR